MPMNTSDVPHLKEQTVADAPKRTEAKEKPDTALASAAASGDPAVQKLLAEIETHQSNGDTEREAEVRKELASLGYK